MAKRGGGGGDDIFEALQDFTSKDNWDKFFTLRGSGDYFEWYANWRSIEAPLLSLLSGSGGTDLRILVPGCGSSSVSEKLYDAGYRQITNIDFSKVVVSDMLRRNVRSRPEMRWRVMDMTEMQVIGNIGIIPGFPFLCFNLRLNGKVSTLKLKSLFAATSLVTTLSSIWFTLLVNSRDLSVSCDENLFLSQV